MEQKTYKTYRQQLSKLRSRGMVIKQGSQGSRVMRILERENYYNVINGYKELFLDHPATAIADGLSCRVERHILTNCQQWQLFLLKFMRFIGIRSSSPARVHDSKPHLLFYRKDVI